MTNQGEVENKNMDTCPQCGLVRQCLCCEARDKRIEELVARISELEAELKLQEKAWNTLSDKNQELRHQIEELRKENENLRSIGYDRAGGFFPFIEKLQKEHQVLQSRIKTLEEALEDIKIECDPSEPIYNIAKKALEGERKQ